MQKYIAWLNGESVARENTIAEAQQKAIEIAQTARWREWNPSTQLRITYGERQDPVLIQVLDS